VQKLLKGFLIAAGVVLGVAAVGVLAINLYVQSAGTQKRIEDALSSGLKAPVHLTSMIVTPWSGLKASGITVPQTPPQNGNFLEATAFTAHFDWLALFKHRLDAGEVTLEEPRIEWFQSASGRWDLPRETPPPVEPKVKRPAPTPSTTPAMTPAVGPEVKPAATPAIGPQASPGAVAPVVAAKTPAPAVRPWEASVGKLMVKGANFDFWDEKGIRVLQFAGVEFDCLNPRASGTKGTAACKYVSLHDRLFLSDMQTNWEFEKGYLKFSDFQTNVGGGAIRGDAEVSTFAKHSPFNADVKFDGVNVDRLITESGEPAGEVTGTLKGRMDVSGNSGKTSSLNGTGHLELAGGRMQNIELLQMLGKGLQIPDLVELNLKTAEVDARVVNGVVNIDKLLMQSQNLQVTGTGTLELGGKLALKARLTVNGVISERVPSFILTYFSAGETADSRYIDFDVDNTLSHPKTDLLEKILGRRVQSQVTDLIKSIFGKKQQNIEPEGSPP
jgi:type II secretion system protein N